MKPYHAHNMLDNLFDNILFLYHSCLSQVPVKGATMKYTLVIACTLLTACATTTPSPAAQHQVGPTPQQQVRLAHLKAFITDRCVQSVQTDSVRKLGHPTIQLVVGHSGVVFRAQHAHATRGYLNIAVGQITNRGEFKILFELTDADGDGIVDFGQTGTGDALYMSERLGTVTGPQFRERWQRELNSAIVLLEKLLAKKIPGCLSI
jgi:hypothetical protein